MGSNTRAILKSGSRSKRFGNHQHKAYADIIVTKTGLISQTIILECFFSFSFCFILQLPWGLLQSVVVLPACFAKLPYPTYGHLSKQQWQNELIWIADVLMSPFEGFKHALIKSKAEQGRGFLKLLKYCGCIFFNIGILFSVTQWICRAQIG